MSILYISHIISFDRGPATGIAELLRMFQVPQISELGQLATSLQMILQGKLQTVLAQNPFGEGSQGQSNPTHCYEYPRSATSLVSVPSC